MHAEIPRLAGKTTIFSEHEVQNYQFPEIYMLGMLLYVLSYSFRNHARFEQFDWLKVVRLQPKSNYLEL